MGRYYKKIKKMARLHRQATGAMCEQRPLGFIPKLTTITPEERAKERSGVYSYII